VTVQKRSVLLQYSSNITNSKLGLWNACTIKAGKLLMLHYAPTGFREQDRDSATSKMSSLGTH
jgi:hypothetical protein